MALVIAALLVAGCSGEEVAGGYPSVRYTHDSERGVGCWYSGYGISCLPDSQYKAPRP